MSNARSAPARRRAARVLIVFVTLLAASLTAAAAPAAATCSSPPDVFPEGSITPGMTGTGLATVQGNTPTSFDIEVIGTLPDAVLPGFDLVMFQITGPQAFLDKAHGMFFGMSGSPIYINGKLAGAASYRFFFSDSTIGLFTPAQSMVDLLGYSSGGSAAVAMPTSVPVTRQARTAVARAAAVSVGTVPTSAQKLTIPLAVSGLSPRIERRLQSIIDDHGLPLQVYSSGAVHTASVDDPAPLAAGAPMTALLSSGDTTFGGIGTTTFACGDLNVGWGHDFFFEGPTSFAMGSADVITVLDDPSGILGPSEIAAPTDIHGLVTQDRLAGIVGEAGAEPSVMPVTSTFTNTDNSKTRSGETDIFYQKDFWGPEITFSHMIQNLLLVFDRFGDGTLRLSYTIQGLRADGVTPFTVSNRNMEASEYDAFEALYRMLNALYDLAFNPFEHITFTSVDATGAITADQLAGDIVGIRTSSSLQPTLRVRPVLRARPGSMITLEVALAPVAGGDTVKATVLLKIPRSAEGLHRISFRGGRARSSSVDRSEPSSFDDLLAALNGGEHPNDLVTTGLGRYIVQEQDLVVRGRAGIYVDVVR